MYKNDAENLELIRKELGEHLIFFSVCIKVFEFIISCVKPNTYFELSFA